MTIVLYNSRAYSKIIALAGSNKIILTIIDRMLNYGMNVNGCIWIVPGTIEE